MIANINPSPLPALDSPRLEKLENANSDLLGAYNIVLRAERQAVRQEHLISARLVGYFLLELHERRYIFGDKPCNTLGLWLTSMPGTKGASENDVVYDVGKDLRDKFIRLFRPPNARYRPPSDHPSCPSFDTLEDMIKDTLEPASKGYRTPRQKALARGNFRCMITGILDMSSTIHCPDLLDNARREGSGTVPAVIETAQILSESAIQEIDPEDSKNSTGANKNRHAATALAMLDALGFSHFAEAFRKSGGTHHLWNLLSLEYNLYSHFHSFRLWFELTEQPNLYKICLLYDSLEDYIRRNFQRKPLVDGAPMYVELASQSADVPLPDPRLLALHAACARAAHMSATAEYFDKLETDEEDTSVLAPDGSSASLLSHLLSPFGEPGTSSYLQAMT